MIMDNWNYDGERRSRLKGGMMKWSNHSPRQTDSSATSGAGSSSSRDSGGSMKYMMKELQTGFTAAMGELTKIQDEDHQLHHKLDVSKSEQDTQIMSILDIVNSLRSQCDAIQRELEVSNRNQRSLEEQVNQLKSEKSARLTVNGEALKLLDKRVASDGNFTNPMMKPFIASLPLAPNNGEETVSEDSDSSLAEITRKNLILTNALAQKAYSNNNSNMDGEENSSHTSSKEEECLPSHLVADCAENPVNQHLILKRENILRGVVESERHYCTSLYILIENYSKPLVSSGAITSKDCNKIFSPSLMRIYEHHCSLLKGLEKRLAHWRKQDVVGDLVGKFCGMKQVEGDILSAYREYIQNFSCALKTIRRLTKSSEKFRAAVRKCQRESSGDRQSIVTQLLAPVRRIPTYIISIKKLLKYTSSDHPDCFFLDASLQTFRDALKSMNEVMETSIQHATSALNDTHSRRFEETCSFSSHEEDQRMSTATKDSGIHSNCGEIDDEIPPMNAKATKKMPWKSSSAKTSQRVKSLPQRPHSVMEIRAYDTSSLPRRMCNTPTTEYKPHHEHSKLHKVTLYHSTPNLLDTNSEQEDQPIIPRSKPKHKVQFKNPPTEELAIRQHKRTKRRSISDTLRLFFNRRKGRGEGAGSDIYDSCGDLTSSMDEIPSPPEMFANGQLDSLPPMEEEPLDDETYEDENGDPYSIV